MTEQPPTPEISAFKGALTRLDAALVQTPVDRTALLLAIGEGMSLLMTREMERLGCRSASDLPGQMHLWPK